MKATPISAVSLLRTKMPKHLCLYRAEQLSTAILSVCLYQAVLGNARAGSHCLLTQCYSSGGKKAPWFLHSGWLCGKQDSYLLATEEMLAAPNTWSLALPLLLLLTWAMPFYPTAEAGPLFGKRNTHRKKQALLKQRITDQCPRNCFYNINYSWGSVWLGAEIHSSVSVIGPGSPPSALLLSNIFGQESQFRRQPRVRSPWKLDTVVLLFKSLTHLFTTVGWKSNLCFSFQFQNRYISWVWSKY